MAGEDAQYTTWLREQPCCVGGDCQGSVQVHHITGAGLALRAHDHDGMPLCGKHHADLHAARGYFRMMTRDEKRSWQRARVAEYLALREQEGF
jgi:hypothetical protein